MDQYPRAGGCFFVDGQPNGLDLVLLGVIFAGYFFARIEPLVDCATAGGENVEVFSVA
jgi:hypothetical protein